MADQPAVPVRERTRQIARRELTDIAQHLFAQRGYSETTMEDIAAAAGMSKRTLFRYFASKDDLVLGKYDVFGERLAEALAARPVDEPLWTSLRRVLDLTVVYFEDGEARDRSEAMERIVRSTPALYAGYLERLSRAERLVADEAQRRLTGPGAALRASVITGAAFACLAAAQREFHERGGEADIGALLDAAMTAVPFAS